MSSFHSNNQTHHLDLLIGGKRTGEKERKREREREKEKRERERERKRDKQTGRDEIIYIYKEYSKRRKKRVIMNDYTA